MTREPIRFCGQRYINGGWYSVEFSAVDWADAKNVCQRAGFKLDGELKAKIPAAPGVGLFVRLFTWMKNRGDR